MFCQVLARFGERFLAKYDSVSLIFGGSQVNDFSPRRWVQIAVVVEANRARLKQFVVDEQVDVLILDLDSNYSSAQQQLALFDEIKDSLIPVVVMTDDNRRSTAIELLQRGACDYLRKPPSLPELKIVVRRAHEHAILKKELEKTKEKLRAVSRCDQLIGSSARSQVVYDLIRRVSNLDAFVLITGKSGNGKELVACAIHNLSNRAKEPFVPVRVRFRIR